MTQIPDPTRTDEDRRQQPPYFRIPSEIIRQPLFANLTNVSFMQGGFYLDFAYVDPYQLGNSRNEIAPDGRPIIDATPVIRLALTPESILPLYQRLHDILEDISRNNQTQNHSEVSGDSL